jgi:hypothetical protein
MVLGISSICKVVVGLLVNNRRKVRIRLATQQCQFPTSSYSSKHNVILYFIYLPFSDPYYMMPTMAASG